MCLLEKNHWGAHQSKGIYAWHGDKVTVDPPGGGPTWSAKYKSKSKHIPVMTHLEQYME